MFHPGMSAWDAFSTVAQQRGFSIRKVEGW